jgi:predicted transcriptional regulator of viral defense system
MANKEKILDYANLNGGIVTTKEIDHLGVTRKRLSDLVKEEKLYRLERGIYSTENGWLDDYFALQYKLNSGVYSHETALYLLGYSDRVPLNVVMSFPYGSNTTRIKSYDVTPIVVSKNFELGITEVERPGGRTVRVYNIERTLVDLLKTKYWADIEQLIPAFQRYAKSKDKNIGRLMDYAKTFGVEDKVRTYIEVLL